MRNSKKTISLSYSRRTQNMIPYMIEHWYLIPALIRRGNEDFPEFFAADVSCSKLNSKVGKKKVCIFLLRSCLQSDIECLKGHKSPESESVIYWLTDWGCCKRCYRIEKHDTWWVFWWFCICFCICVFVLVFVFVIIFVIVDTDDI